MTIRYLNLTLATDHFEVVRSTGEVDAHIDEDSGEVVDMDGEPVAPAPAEEVERTHPVRVDAEFVAYFHPRQKSRTGRVRVGTRLVMKNGHAVAVREEYDAVHAMIIG